MVAAHVNGALPRGFTAVSVHLKDGIKATGCNLEFLEVLGTYIASCGEAWVAGGDWNMSPHELMASGWLTQVSGEIVASSDITCTSGHGDVLDYFVVSAGLSA
eukprot:7811667-Karenia_brevis.AAC.1